MKIELLKEIARIANREARRLTGRRANCVLVSRVSCEVLPVLGDRCASTASKGSVHHPSDRRAIGNVLGSDGDGPRSKPGMWKGHLVVLADQRWLIDATIDQNHGRNGWVELDDVFVGEVPIGFLEGEASCRSSLGNAEVSYRVRRRQVGWKSAPDWRRESNWEPLVRMVLRGLPGPRKGPSCKRPSRSSRFAIRSECDSGGRGLAQTIQRLEMLYVWGDYTLTFCKWLMRNDGS